MKTTDGAEAAGEEIVSEDRTIVEIRAIVRMEMLDRVVHCLKAAGCPRLSVTRAHAIGSGVDPAFAKISFEEGTEYTDKAMVSLICAENRCAMYTELIAKTARTGRQGDGIVSVHPVLQVSKIRTGIGGLEALD